MVMDLENLRMVPGVDNLSKHAKFPLNPEQEEVFFSRLQRGGADAATSFKPHRGLVNFRLWLQAEVDADALWRPLKPSKQTFTAPYDAHQPDKAHGE